MVFAWLGDDDAFLEALKTIQIGDAVVIKFPRTKFTAGPESVPTPSSRTPTGRRSISTFPGASFCGATPTVLSRPTPCFRRAAPKRATPSSASCVVWATSRTLRNRRRHHVRPQ